MTVHVLELAIRGWIHGMDQRGGGCIIVATAPMQFMLGYTNRLHGMTQGRATVAMTFDHYAPLGGPDDFDPPGGAMAMRIA